MTIESIVATGATTANAVTITPSNPAHEGAHAGAPASAQQTRTGLTVEHLLYGLVLLLALGLRLFALGKLFYTPLEAANSWQAWLDAMALQVVNSPQPTSALLHSAQTVLFWLFGGGGNDAAGNLLGRLPVALAGSMIVLLPWFWRDVLGRWSALALAVLIAIDPWLLTLGRMADSTILSAAAALAALTALHVAARDKGADAPGAGARFSGAVAAIAVGLLLASGMQAWPWLIVVAAYGLIVEPVGFRTLATPRNGVLLLAAFLLGATTFLTQPDTLRVVSGSLSNWLQRFGGSEYGLGWLAVRLLVDSPLLVVFAIVGVVRVWRLPANADGDGASPIVLLRMWSTLWLVFGLVMLILPGRSPLDFALFATALAVFAAVAIGAIVEALIRNYAADTWQDATLLGAVLAVIALGVLFWGTGAIWSSEWSNMDWFVTIGFILLIIVLVAIFAALVNRRQAMLIGLLLLGGVLLALSVTSANHLTSPARSGYPNGLFAEAVYPDLHHLPEDVRTLSDRRKGDNRELPVLVINDATRTPDPLLGWTLRSMRNLRFVDSWQVVATYAGQIPPLVITPGEDVAVSQWNQYYLGSPYRTTVRWLPDALPSLTNRAEGSNFWTVSGRPWLRWLLLRQATPSVPDQINLWATAK